MASKTPDPLFTRSKRPGLFHRSAVLEWSGGFLFMFKIDQTLTCRIRHYMTAMKRDLTVKQALRVRCPICGAPPGKKCELSTGQPRTDPHKDRRIQVKE
jgi:hypothetical protein